VEDRCAVGQDQRKRWHLTCHTEPEVKPHYHAWTGPRHRQAPSRDRRRSVNAALTSMSPWLGWHSLSVTTKSPTLQTQPTSGVESKGQKGARPIAQSTQPIAARAESADRRARAATTPCRPGETLPLQDVTSATDRGRIDHSHSLDGFPSPRHLSCSRGRYDRK